MADLDVRCPEKGECLELYLHGVLYFMTLTGSPDDPEALFAIVSIGQPGNAIQSQRVDTREEAGEWFTKMMNEMPWQARN